MTDLTNPIFTDETKAREHFEAVRWPNGPVCPHCGEAENVKRLEGKSHRPGLFQCNSCREHFTVMVGSVMERSHIPLTKWALAFHLVAASKKGISAHQLHRMLGITYRSAWFMEHRIREAMREPFTGPMGSGGGTVEVDETFVGGKEKNRHAKKRQSTTRGTKGKPKEAVLALVERGAKVRSFHIASVNGKTLRPILRQQISQSAHLRTDENRAYGMARKDFATHETVNHSIEEYVRGTAHTNTIEGYFGILKRGLTGVYQHVSPEHLKRYLAEFDFRYNEREALGVNDHERAIKAIKGAEGKRLTYTQSVG